jgi:membrane protein DedA with SNARE-associated domain
MWTNDDWLILAAIFGGVLGIIMLFAIGRLFTIATTLKEILAELRKRNGAEVPYFKSERSAGQ